MTDRGLPIVDGAPACPFVAFEDDRDERGTSPDHRHRCYAEQTPAPRALAHQEAYCLASAFPVCPTFQDWARREAARARVPSGGVRPARVEDEPQRNPPRDWLSPPPWTGGDGPDGDEGEAAEDASAPDFLSDRSRPERGLAGSAADRLASSIGPASDEPRSEPGAAEPPVDARLETPGEPPDEDEHDDGEEAVPLVAPRPEPPRQPTAPSTSRYSAPPPSRAAPPPPPPDEDDEEDWAEDDEWEEEPRRRQPPGRAAAEVGGGLGRDRRPKVGDTRGRQPDRAPSWERPRRYEAYPTLKSRVGLSMPSMGGVPRVGVLALALVVAAIALFFLPALLGLVGGDGDNPGGGGLPSPSVVAEPTPSVEPTPTPAPTPFIHTVGPGDTMSRIANQYGVSLADLIEANRETIPNPDVLNIGDQVIIPARPPDVVPGGGSPGASPAP